MNRKIMLITGGSRGIGAATARLAAERGYDICINYATDEAAAEVVASDCRSLGAKTITVAADIANADAVKDMFVTCDEQLGKVDVVVNNAGITGKATTVADLPPDIMRRTFEVNVYGTLFCAQEAIFRMSTDTGGQGGVIINLSSIAATAGSPNEYVHYAASKGAVDSFTIGLSKEVGPQGIRVNAIQAGTTDTGIHARSGNPERPAAVAQNAPLRRVGQPTDIAESIIWLASDAADYVTGAILKVGGGL